MCRKTNPRQAMKRDSRNVRFCDVEQVYMIEVIGKNGKSELWYSKPDLASRNNVVETTTTTGSSNRTCRRELVSGLLQQQQEHKQMGLQDPRGLFQFSRASSKQSRQAALQLGREHEKEVKSFQERKVQTLAMIDDVFALIQEC